jgi:hypothetical protein
MNHTGFPMVKNYLMDSLNKNKNIMNKEFIPYEQALELKELGFDEPCILKYRGLDTQPVCQMDYEFKTEKNSDFNDETNYWLTVPTFSQAFRWFREKKLHNIFPSVIQTRSWATLYKIIEWHPSNDSTSIIESGYYNSPEEAELACLNKLIEIVKKQNICTE